MSERRTFRDGALHDELLNMAAHPNDADLRRLDAARLWDILDDYEVWPGRALVGDDGEHAAWLIVQRAIDDPGLQRRCLEMLELAVDCGDADPVHLAYLSDRVRMADGRDQLYGSQFVVGADGNLEPWPVDDPVLVDDRRHRLGLPPFTAHAAEMTQWWRDHSVRVSTARQQYHAATER